MVIWIVESIMGTLFDTESEFRIKHEMAQFQKNTYNQPPTMTKLDERKNAIKHFIHSIQN